MKKWNYSRTDTMPIGYTVIMIRPEGAEFPPEYSDRNLIVKTQCVIAIAELLRLYLSVARHDLHS